MTRSVVRRVNPPAPPRRRMDGGRMIAAGVVVLFALIGVVSAGRYLSDSFASAKPNASGSHHKTTTGNNSASLALARAGTQATSIVRAAETSGRRQAKAELKQAQRKAARLVAAARRSTSSSTSAHPSSAASTQPIPTATTLPVISSSGPSSSGGSSAGTGSSAVPDLSSAPASWLVVGYNVAWGGGSGVGSISVINRSRGSLSGTALVQYYGPKGGLGSSEASFTDLGAGQSETLSLQGDAYPASASGYHIVISNVH
ncbi:MAG: hypothetical protein ACRDFS_02705 [Chloroflexota bacterium]